MKNVKIQGKEIKNEDELHKLLKKELEFPDHYGENLNALWDCLGDLMPNEILIEWFDFNISKVNFTTYENGFNEAEGFLEVFQYAEKSELMAGRFKLIIHE